MPYASVPQRPIEHYRLLLDGRGLHRLAVTCLVLGLLSLVFPPITIVLAIPALGLGYAVRGIAREHRSRSLAEAGSICAAAGLIIGVIIWAWALPGIVVVPGMP